MLTMANPQLIWGLYWHQQICIGLKTDATLATNPTGIPAPWGDWYWTDGTPADWNGFAVGDGTLDNLGQASDGMSYVRKVP